MGVAMPLMHLKQTFLFLCISPMFGRGAGGVGRSFDARQKIGANDVRQRLGGGAGAGKDTVAQVHLCLIFSESQLTWKFGGLRLNPPLLSHPYLMVFLQGFK